MPESTELTEGGWGPDCPQPGPWAWAKVLPWRQGPRRTIPVPKAQISEDDCYVGALSFQAGFSPHFPILLQICRGKELSKEKLSKDPKEQVPNATRKAQSRSRASRGRAWGLQLTPAWLASSGQTFTRTVPDSCAGRSPHKPCEPGFTLLPLHR